MKEFKLNATYSPQKQIDTVPTNFTFDGASVSGFTIAGNTLTSTGAVVNQGWMNKSDVEGLDQNGGW